MHISEKGFRGALCFRKSTPLAKRVLTGSWVAVQNSSLVGKKIQRALIISLNIIISVLFVLTLSALKPVILLLKCL